MKNKELYKIALALAVPMMIQNAITNMVGMVDSIMVGSLGTEAITAVSIIGQLIFVFNLGIFGCLSGPGIFGAQYFGKGDLENVRNTFRLKLWLSTLVVLLGTLVFIFGGDFLIARYLRGEAADVDLSLTVSMAKDYLAIMLFSFLPFAYTQVYAGTLRETGSSIPAMAAGIVSVVTDIVLNYLFIFGKFGCPQLGVRGAALATVIARVVEFVVLVSWVHWNKHRYEVIRGIYRTVLLPIKLALTIVKNGLPIFLNEFMWAAGIAVMTQCYSIRGMDIVPGLNIANVLMNLFNVVFIAMGNAVGILSGQRLGASEFDRAKKDAFALARFTGLLCLGLTVILLGLSQFFPNLYHTSDQVRHHATLFIMIQAAFLPVQGILNTLYFTIRSGGKTMITFLFDSVYSWVITVPIAFLLSNFTGISIFIIFTIIQCCDVIKLLVGWYLVKKGVWIVNIANAKGSSESAST